ncbi:MAG: RelA/SpoT family protein, partial [Bacteroidales bacterium]|nr:RelA/SpoT family protein [Bacteroidales bacterium]
MQKLRKAYELVLEYHRPNWEETGEDHVYHSIEVARIVTRELNLGVTSVVCALLHNVVDGKKITITDIRKTFGKNVAIIVEGYTKLSGLDTEKINVHSENFRKLYLTIIKDIRVILIKLAHRLQDMRYFSCVDKKKGELFLNEVFHLYIPIAHRLGLYNIKTELEELWMKHNNSEIYKGLLVKIRDSRVKQRAYIQDFINPIQIELIRQGYNADIIGRPKSVYSIWKKMKKQNVEFEEVYDLFAVRIIVDSEKKNEKADCWKVFSIVTDKYQPNPGRLRDWISSPKASGYESLHTTVVGINGKWVEVQIRTRRMDEMAEKGLAAHWRYKEGRTGREHEEWLKLIREVVEHKSENKLDKSGARIELYSDKTFVFTPEGDLKKLPAGSTVLDFAYDIHTSVGDMCSGAKVNNRIVPIRYIMRNGDRVEIMTSKNQKPKLDWLNFVITNKAKAKIKRSIREERFREAENGKEILRRKLRNRKIAFNDLVVDRLIRHYKLKSSVDLYYLIAAEKIELADIKKIIAENESSSGAVNKTVKTNWQDRVVKPPEDDFMVIGEDIDNLNYDLAKCCSPKFGDQVFGFITVGKGITIHKDSCPNAKRLRKNYDYRVIEVAWRKAETDKGEMVYIRVRGKDYRGLLNRITKVISEDLEI